MLPILLALVLPGRDPCPGLPVASQTSWTYTVDVAWTAAGKNTANRATLRWTTAVMDVAVADSAAVATVRGWPSELAWWEPGQVPRVSLLHCVGGRVYHVTPGPGAAVLPLIDSLLYRTRRPSLDDLILQLPLRSGLLYGRDSLERTDTFYAWFVEGAEPAPPQWRRFGPGLADSLYHLGYRTMPDHQIVAFLPGLGITEYVYGHHGTTAEADARLVDFHRGPR
jgi:hypothetical protein